MSASSAAAALQRLPGSGPSAEPSEPKCPPALSAKIWRLRFLSICAIVLVHTHAGFPKASGSGPAWSMLRVMDLAVTGGFARIALPFFFSVSGYFFFLKVRGPVSAWYWPQIRKRLKSLAIPYLAWTGAATLLTVGVRFTPSARDLVLGNRFHFPAAVWVDRIVLHPIPSPFWSIRELLLYAAVTPLIWVALRFAGKPTLLLLALWWYLDPDPERQFLRSRTLFFFCFGAYLALRAFPLDRFSLLKYRWRLAFLWAALVLGKSVLTLSFGLYCQLFHMASIGVGILTMWTFHERLPLALRAILQRLSSHVFFVFGAHYLVIQRFGQLWLRAWGPSNPIAHLAFDIAGPALAIVASILFAFAMKRLWSAGYAAATGWRPAPPTLKPL